MCSNMENFENACQHLTSSRGYFCYRFRHVTKGARPSAAKAIAGSLNQLIQLWKLTRILLFPKESKMNVLTSVFQAEVAQNFQNDPQHRTG